MNIAENLKKGTTEILLLTLLNQNDMYGYQITQELSNKSKHLYILKEGSLYPILYRLQEQGYVSCRQEIVMNRRKRIYYHLEPEGAVYLKQVREEYLTLSEGIKNVLNNAGAVQNNEK